MLNLSHYDFSSLSIDQQELKRIKVSLLTDEDRDQLLKEMAYGFSLKELSKKYHLKPIQVEYQRGNNSALYNMYLDFFCIKEEIIRMELPEIYQFVLNILWNKIKVLGNGRYLYKGNIYKLPELIPFANEVLKREDLPLVEIGKPVKVRYSAKRDASQQISKADLMDEIKKFKCIEETFRNKDIATPPVAEKKQFLKVILTKKCNRVSWKNGIIVDQEHIEELPMIKLWYRILTEGRSRPRGRPLGELNTLFDVLHHYDMLSSNWATVTIDENNDTVFTLNESMKNKFQFYAFPICKRIENFINKLFVEADYKFMNIACYIGSHISEGYLEQNYDKLKDFTEKLFNSSDDFLKSVTNFVMSKKPDESIEEIFTMPISEN